MKKIIYAMAATLLSIRSSKDNNQTSGVAKITAALVTENTEQGKPKQPLL